MSRRESEMPVGVTLTMTTRWPDELGRKMSWETEYPDAKIDDVFDGFVACMIGHTWLPDQIYRAMKEYAEEHLPEEPDDELTCQNESL